MEVPKANIMFNGFDLINHAIRMGSVEDGWSQGVGVLNPRSHVTTQHPPQLEQPKLAPQQPVLLSGSSPSQSSNSQSFQFPWKLHDMLEQAENDGMTDIVSWQDDGKSFRVKQPAAFVDEIMPMYFKQTKYKSFQRQLNLYGYTRINEGPAKGGYRHKFFAKGNKALCQYITRSSQTNEDPTAHLRDLNSVVDGNASTPSCRAAMSTAPVQALITASINSSLHESRPVATVSPESSTYEAVVCQESETNEINDQYKALIQKDYQFPWKLHEMLERSSIDDYDDIVSWQPGDYCFKVHDPQKFMSILPRFFKQTKYKSFQRQLNLYGFTRVDEGPNRGSYRHNLFQKNRKDLLSSMNRMRNVQSENRSQLKTNESVGSGTSVPLPMIVPTHTALSKPALPETPHKSKAKCIDCGISAALKSMGKYDTVESMDDSVKTESDGLHWRNPSSKSSSDWIIVVLHNDTFERESYDVHCQVIADADKGSEYFARQFQASKMTSPTSKETDLVLGNAEAAAFPKLLDYLYSGVKPKLNMQKAYAFLSLSTHLEIPSLGRFVLDFYIENMNKDDMNLLIQIAPSFGDKALLEAAVNKFSREMASMKTTVVGKLEPSLLLQLILKWKTFPESLHWDSSHSSLFVAACVKHNFNIMTLERFRQLTRQEVIPAVDATAAISLLASESNLFKDDQPDLSLRQRCVSSICENWDKLREELQKNHNLADSFKSLHSGVLYEILMITTGLAVKTMPNSADTEAVNEILN